MQIKFVDSRRARALVPARSKPGQCWLLLLLLPHPLPAQPTARKASVTSWVSRNHAVRGGGATLRVLPRPFGTAAQTVPVLALGLPHRHHSTAARRHFPPSLHAHARVGGVTPCPKFTGSPRVAFSPLALRALQGAAAQQPMSAFAPLWPLFP